MMDETVDGGDTSSARMETMRRGRLVPRAIRGGPQACSTSQPSRQRAVLSVDSRGDEARCILACVPERLPSPGAGLGHRGVGTGNNAHPE